MQLPSASAVYGPLLQPHVELILHRPFLLPRLNDERGENNVRGGGGRAERGRRKGGAGEEEGQSRGGVWEGWGRGEGVREVENEGKGDRG